MLVEFGLQTMIQQTKGTERERRCQRARLGSLPRRESNESSAVLGEMAEVAAVLELTAALRAQDKTRRLRRLGRARPEAGNRFL